MSEQAVALVTGARTGIGRGLATHLTSRGYVVVGCGRTPAESADAFAAFVPTDVADEASVRAMVRTVSDRFGRLDVVVNNAGVASMNFSLLTPTETFDRLFATNVRGTFLVSREAARLMRRRQFGRIVNLTSVAVPLQLAGEAAYVASKAAVEALTRVMARELVPFGITVNAIGPMPIDTDLLRGVPRDTLHRLVDRMAIGRLGRIDDVIPALDFFIAPNNEAVTGQVVYLGGPA